MMQLQPYRFVPGLIALGLVAGGCDEGKVVQPAPPVKASEWINSVNWDQRTVVTVTMVESSPTTMSFSPNQLTLEAGKPYVLRIVNPASNTSKHYFSPDTVPPAGLRDFYKAVATRKIETTQAEYKAPHFNEVELYINGSLDIYFVPVLPGTYDILCTIPGHKGFGMTARVTITGSAGNQLDLEVAPDFNQALATDPRRSGGHAVWSTVVRDTVNIVEQPVYNFEPKDLPLVKDVGYELHIDNPAAHASKHYYTAAQFYKTVVLRKADDGQGEIKAPYLSAVEMMIGGHTKLFIVPTQSGTFEVLCTIPGHADAGMKGTIVVSATAGT